MCRSIANTIYVDREYAGCARWDGHGLLGKLDAAYVELDATFGRQGTEPFVVVHKDKSSSFAGAIRPSQVAVVSLWNILFTREVSFHRCQLLSIVLHEEVEFPQHVIVGITLSEFIEGCLEVVVQHRQVVVVCGQASLGLIEIHVGDFATGVRASVIHVVA